MKRLYKSVLFSFVFCFLFLYRPLSAMDKEENREGQEKIENLKERVDYLEFKLSESERKRRETESELQRVREEFIDLILYNAPEDIREMVRALEESYKRTLSERTEVSNYALKQESEKLKKEITELKKSLDETKSELSRKRDLSIDFEKKLQDLTEKAADEALKEENEKLKKKITQINKKLETTMQDLIVEKEARLLSEKKLQKLTEESDIGEEPELKYEVREGDSLSIIAEQLYGDSSRWKEIYEANRDVLQERGLFEGLMLDIP